MLKDVRSLFDLSLWKANAKRGDKFAQFRLGQCYSEGYLVEKDLETAFNWYLKSAEQGYSSAQFEVAMAYYLGDSVTYNLFEAEKWCRKAAEQGHVEAEMLMVHIASIFWFYEHKRAGYSENEKTKEYSEKQLYWLKKAAADGHPEALYQMGQEYICGVNVEEDVKKGVELIKLAARKGYEEACEDIEGSILLQSLAMKYEISLKQ